MRSYKSNGLKNNIQEIPRPGIYMLLNTANGFRYVGYSIDLLRRKKEHYARLRGNKHPNYNLQKDWNEFGEENFVFEILEVIENQGDFAQRELFWIEQYEPEYNTLNKNRVPLTQPPFEESAIYKGTITIAFTSGIETIRRLEGMAADYENGDTNSFLKYLIDKEWEQF